VHQVGFHYIVLRDSTHCIRLWKGRWLFSETKFQTVCPLTGKMGAIKLELCLFPEATHHDGPRIKNRVNLPQRSKYNLDSDLMTWRRWLQSSCLL